MPRRYLQFTKGSYYHVYNRGFERQSIFREERNYHYLLDLLMTVAAECEVSVIAYCLLPNHYHWLLRQDGDTPVREVPRRVFGSYSQAFNKAYKRRGTLFDQRYQAILVDSDVYL
ncbi:MAG: transposase [Chloroflexota bacterium]